MNIGYLILKLFGLSRPAAAPEFPLQHMRLAAEKGHVDAQFNLGVMYDTGDGVPKDKQQALAWYHRAAEQGHADAQFNLGVMYDTGEGVPEDKQQALAWYHRAAEQGHADALFNLGVMYDTGEDVPEDKQQALAWYHRAAEQGHADAQFNLGVMYDTGEGVQEDKQQALAWYHRAAEQGHSDAQFNLGVINDTGESVPEDAKGCVVTHTRFTVLPEREPLMGFGALMLHRNGRHTRTLYVDPFDKDNIDMLLADWDIMDNETARVQIHGLIQEGRRTHFQSDFAGLQAGESLARLKSFDGNDYQRWKNAREVWKLETVLPSEVIKNCRSMAAFDYERIAFLARSCHLAGFLTELEMWRCLAWVAKQVKPEFLNWAEYAASFVLGRAATYACSCESCHSEGIDAARQLLTDESGLQEGHLWQQYPLASIQIPVELISIPASDNLLPTKQLQLLGFGALTAVFSGESYRTLAISGGEPLVDEQWLATNWGIVDTATTRARIDELLATGGRSTYEASFGSFSATMDTVAPHNSEQSVCVRIRLARTALLSSGLGVECVQDCRTLLAYDLEWVAYLVRVAYKVGYIDEKSSWHYLLRVATLSCDSFSGWEDYLVSFLYGHSLLNQQHYSPEPFIRAGMNLLNVQSPFPEFFSIWQAYPLKDISVLHSVGQGAVFLTNT